MMDPAPFRWLEGRLLCLPGSALALGAFFLPTFGGPGGSGWQVMLVGLGLTKMEDSGGFLFFALLAAGYLLSVASLFLFALWMTFRSPNQTVLRWCSLLTCAALAIYGTTLGAVILLTLFLLVLIHFQAVFDFLFIMFHIGALLIPVSLTLVLLGIRWFRRAKFVSLSR
jgi:hypothetical protein